MQPRWKAECYYQNEKVPEVFRFEEIEDLHDIIEQGPDWNTLDRVVVTLNRPSVEPKKEVSDV